MKILIRAICLAIICLLFSAAHAEDREWVSYKKLVETTYLDKFYKADPAQRKNLTLLIRITPVNKAITPASMVLTAVHAGGKDKLPLRSDGILELIPDQSWIKEDVMIFTNLPKSEKSSINPIFAVNLPESLNVGYKDMMAGVAGWSALIKEQAGLLRFMLPKLNGIDIHFAPGGKQILQVISKDGTKTFTPDADGEIKLKTVDALLLENAQIVFSEKPTLVEVDEI